jgi:hypothetical protein
MVRRLATVFVVVALASGGLLQSASATDQGSLGTMSPENKHVKKTFLPIVGLYPAESPVQPFSIYRPFICTTSTYCDRITFQVKYPADYLVSLRGTKYVSFGIKVSLSWPGHDANDLDLFVWPDDDPALGGPQGPCATPLDAECNKLYPEVYDVIEPSPPDDDPATEEDESKDPIEVYISVVNHSGINQGYTIDLQWHLIELGELPKLERKDLGFASRLTSPSPPKVSDAKAATDPTPAGPTRTVLVPGPDGKLVERELPVLAAGNRFEPSGGGVPLLPIGIGVAVLGGAIVALLIVRRRRLEEG